jgi:flagellar biosynthetic protein FlhB
LHQLRSEVSDPQRTQKATPKRVRDFRKRGDIALSRDLVSAATLTGGAIALVAGAGATITALLGLTRDAALAADGRSTDGLVGAAARTFATATAPVLIGALVAALAAILGQLGWPPAFKGIKLELGRMSPAKNLAQAFGLSAAVRRTGSAIAKLVVVGAVVVMCVRGGISTEALEARGIGALAWAAVGKALWLVIGALILVAAIDYILAAASASR